MGVGVTPMKVGGVHMHQEITEVIVETIDLVMTMVAVVKGIEEGREMKISKGQQ